MSVEELRKVLEILGKNSEENRKIIGMVEKDSRHILRIPFTYNVNDALKANDEIKKIAKDFNKKIKGCYYDDKELIVEIALTLEKGAPIYKIDDYFSRILSKLKLPKKAKFRVVVNFGDKELGRNDVRYLLDKTESTNLLKLQQIIEKHKGTLFFSELEESDVLWTLNEVIKANDAIYKIAKTIKENDLSPFEALLYICTWAQKNIQYEFSYYHSFELGNTIVSAINNKAIRCVGFSQLVMAVVDVLGIDYLQEEKCLMNMGHIDVAYDKYHYREWSYFVGNHAQSKHYLIDKKYDIDGEIIADVLGRGAFHLWQLENNITLVAGKPLLGFSMIKDENKDFKIYGYGGEISSIDLWSGIVDGKTQSEILEETEKNEKIARTLEQKDISESVWKRAYEKIVPLVFPEAQTEDIIAPIMHLENIQENGTSVSMGLSMGRCIGIMSNEIKSLLMDVLSNTNMVEHSL